MRCAPDVADGSAPGGPRHPAGAGAAVGAVAADPDEDHRVPMVVIDGREISWDELGRRVAAFEGSQFKLEFPDRSDEV